MNRRPILVAAAAEQGRGGGHLLRCAGLVRGLRALGRDSWLLPAGNTNIDFDRSLIIDAAQAQGTNWECVILDRFQTPPEEYARWKQLAPLIGIDEGGPCRNDFDFLIDILPDPGRTNANITDTSLLALPKKTKRFQSLTSSAPFKILVSFGMEDAAGLGDAVMQALAPHNVTNTAKTPIPQLSEHLHEYDLVITHYGLTAFEALYAGVPVLLVSPGAYHEKLAQAAGFYSLGIGKKAARKLPRLLLNFIDNLSKHCADLAVRHNLARAPKQNLAEFINNCKPDISRNCPVCGALMCGTAINGPAIARFTERTYLRCKHCGGIAMNRLNPPPIEYGREYFFENYQKQYGKTYIEDFPHLTAMAHRRLSVIKNLLPAAANETPRLLDIGCAYGPFLLAARNAGFSPCGIDPAEDAVRYVTHDLGIPAVHGFFPGAHAGSETYDVITLWYVIEHFRDCVPVLAEIRKLLKPAGVLAFATPSFSGISGRISLRRFLERSPADHWTIWSPAMCKKALREAGFKVQKTFISGHHPERFPLLGKFARSTKSPLYWPLFAISKLFALGDTFEIYAERL